MGTLTRNINKDDVLRVTGRPEDSAKQATDPSPAEQLADQASNVVTQLGQKLAGQPKFRDQLVEQAQDGLEQPISPELKDAIETVRTAVGGSSTMSFMSLQGLFYQAMSVLTEFDIKQMKTFLDYLSKAAQAMGGIDENGRAIVGEDGNITGGLLGKQLDLSFASAEFQGKAMQQEATGHLVQAGFSAFGLGLGGASAIKTGTRGLDKQQMRASQFQKDLHGDTKATQQLAGKEIELESMAKDTSTALTSTETASIQRRKKLIANDKTELSKFIDELQPGHPNNAEAQKVLNHLNGDRGDPVFDKVSKNAKSLIEGLEGQKNANHQKFSSQMNLNNMFVGAGGSAGQGGTKLMGAEDQVDGGKKAAEAEVVKTLNQQMYQTTVANAKAAADGAASDASATAALYGNIKA